MATAIKEILNFSGKTVIITGGRSGMGPRIAERFAETKANIAITYFTEDPKAPVECVVKGLEELGIKAFAIKTDIRSAASSEAMISAVVERFGSVDILVNNAGIYPHHDVLTVNEEQWDNMHNSNLRGAFFCAQAAAKQMIKQGRGGAIVNIVSINAYRPMDNGLVYSASKAGLAMVTKCLGYELGKYRIRVNGVAPGLIDSPMLDANVPGWREAYSMRAPLGRIGQPSDIADACIFYASDLSRWITGEITTVDGGVMHAKAY
jgi:NAD(P)-dependent dehydrogenase (short-subunit alcohol dehydrogenase family)